MFNLDMFFLRSIHEQHERMQNTFQKMQNLQLEIALMSVQYQIHIFRETSTSVKKQMNLSNSVCMYSIHSNMYNNIMQNSFFIESWAFGPHVMLHPVITIYDHPCTSRRISGTVES